MQRAINPITAGGAAAIAALVALLGILTASPAGARDTTQPRPNVIVVMTDDQTVAQLNSEFMPKTLRLLGGENGTQFTRSYVSAPLCCPSRAGLLTGQYPHNNGVADNEPGYPGLRHKDETLFTWLNDAGYRVGHAGRFLLNYDRFSTAPAGLYGGPLPAAPAPPGVDDWFGFKSGFTYYFSAPFSDNGAPITTAAKRSGYATRVISANATSFINESAPSPDPFFLWIGHLAPHSTNVQPRGDCGQGVPLPEPGTYGPYKHAELPDPPSFGEKANRDKPPWVQSRPPLRPRQVRDLTRSWRCAAATLTSVDRSVAHLVRQLESLGELDDTAILFTSDNGYFYGEHRIVLEKIYPYEEAWNVPLLARIPPAYLGGAETPAKVRSTVSNVDLTATILDLADAPPCVADGRCQPIDGRSVLPLLGAPGAPWPADRAVLAQIGNRACGVIPEEGSGLKNFYDAIRTSRYMYAEINRVDPDTGKCDRPAYELYDLKRDPYQLRNRAVNPLRKVPAALQTTLAQRLHALARCAGAAGRDAPQPGSDYDVRPLCE